MNQLLLMGLFMPALIAGCCTSQPLVETKNRKNNVSIKETKPVNGVALDHIVVNDGAGKVVVQKIGFRLGDSSSTVEKLGKHAGCDGEIGAGVITEKGPVEIYRMECTNGTNFLARCESHQCKAMR